MCVKGTTGLLKNWLPFIYKSCEQPVICFKHQTYFILSIFRVFVNRSLAMEKIKCFGFDMDYTLAGKYRAFFSLQLYIVVYIKLSSTMFMLALLFQSILSILCKYTFGEMFFTCSSSVVHCNTV